MENQKVKPAVRSFLPACIADSYLRARKDRSTGQDYPLSVNEFPGLKERINLSEHDMKAITPYLSDRRHLYEVLRSISEREEDQDRDYKKVKTFCPEYGTPESELQQQVSPICLGVLPKVRVSWEDFEHVPAVARYILLKQLEHLNGKQLAESFDLLEEDLANKELNSALEYLQTCSRQGKRNMKSTRAGELVVSRKKTALSKQQLPTALVNKISRFIA